MDQVVAGRAWPARPINMTISDVNRPVDSLTLNISEIEQARDRILDAIRTHTVRNDQGQIIQLDERNGIDILGNMIEASILSPSRNFYGNIHNSGHNAISFIHDPDHRFLVGPLNNTTKVGKVFTHRFTLFCRNRLQSWATRPLP